MKLMYFILFAVSCMTSAIFQPAIALEQNKIDNPFLSDEQVQQLKKGLDAYERENLKTLQLLNQEAISDSTVAQYLQAWLLVTEAKKRPEITDYSDDIQAFLKVHKNDYIAERVQTDLLKVHAEQLHKTNQWKEFTHRRLQLAWNAHDPELLCWDALHHLETAEDGKRQELNKAILSLLKTSSNNRFNSCQRAAELMLEKTPETIFPLLIILTQENRITQSKQFLKKYENLTSFPYQQTLLALTKPEVWYKNQHQKLNRESDPRIALLVAFRLSRENPALAIRLARELSTQLHPSDKAALWGRLGYISALSHEKQALDLYQQGGNNVCQSSLLIDESSCLEWQARAALGIQQWNTLADIIDNMPEKLKNQSNWIYWRARIYSINNQHDQARQLWSKLQNVRTFYGKLAAEELGKSILYSTATSWNFDKHHLQKLDQNASLARALLFYSIGMNTSGNREWNWGLRGLPRKQFMDVAQWSQFNGLEHRMINAAERARSADIPHDMFYPQPMQNQILTYAEKAKVDQGWVYGLIHQESRFIHSARSYVGASGLMQLMPSTAKWVAQTIDMHDYSKENIYEPDVNLRLGTAYLRLLLNRLDDNFILATTAYNAGPHRADTWRSRLSTPVEGAIFVETIPFNETRTYVQNVMANMVEYSQYSKTPISSIKQLLGTIDPKPLSLKDKI